MRDQLVALAGLLTLWFLLLAVATSMPRHSFVFPHKNVGPSQARVVASVVVTPDHLRSNWFRVWIHCLEATLRSQDVILLQFPKGPSKHAMPDWVWYHPMIHVHYFDNYSDRDKLENQFWGMALASKKYQLRKDAVVLMVDDEVVYSSDVLRQLIRRMELLPSDENNAVIRVEGYKLMASKVVTLEAVLVSNNSAENSVTWQKVRLQAQKSRGVPPLWTVPYQSSQRLVEETP